MCRQDNISSPKILKTLTRNHSQSGPTTLTCSNCTEVLYGNGYGSSHAEMQSTGLLVNTSAIRQHVRIVRSLADYLGNSQRVPRSRQIVNMKSTTMYLHSGLV